MDIDFIAESIRNTVQDLVRSKFVNDSIKIVLSESEQQENNYRLCIAIKSARNIILRDFIRDTNMYCKINIGTRSIKTKSIESSHEPYWDQCFREDIKVCDDVILETVSIQIKEVVLPTDNTIAVVNVPVQNLKPWQLNTMILDVEKPCHGQLCISAFLEPPIPDTNPIALSIFLDTFNGLVPLPKRNSFFTFRLDNRELCTIPRKHTRNNDIATTYVLYFDKPSRKMTIQFFEEGTADPIEYADVFIPSLKVKEKSTINVNFSQHIRGCLTLGLQLLTYSEIPINPTMGSVTIMLHSFRNLSEPIPDAALVGKLHKMKRVVVGKGKEPMSCWVCVGNDAEEISITDGECFSTITMLVQDQMNQSIRLYIGLSGDAIHSHFCSLKIPLLAVSSTSVSSGWFQFTSATHKFEDGNPEVLLEAMFAPSK